MRGKFSISHDGCILFQCDPDLNGGISIAEMVERSNIVALVGGGDSPKWPTNKVMIWDDYRQKIIGELTFNAQIRSVRINRDVLVVCLFCKTYIFNFWDLTLIDCLDTYDNPTGVVDVARANHSKLQDGLTFG